MAPGNAGQVDYDITASAAPYQIFPVGERDIGAIGAAQIGPDLRRVVSVP